MPIPFSRRRFLEISSVLGGTYTLLSSTEALSAAPPDGLLLFCYFSGGWDQLLALDPRPNNLPEYSKANAYNPTTGSGIYPAYDTVTDPAVQAILQQNPSGIQKAGNLTFGPAVAPSLLAQAS